MKLSSFTAIILGFYLVSAAVGNQIIYCSTDPIDPIFTIQHDNVTKTLISAYRQKNCISNITIYWKEKKKLIFKECLDIYYVRIN